jgi:hypothetical protein
MAHPSEFYANHDRAFLTARLHRSSFCPFDPADPTNSSPTSENGPSSATAALSLCMSAAILHCAGNMNCSSSDYCSKPEGISFQLARVVHLRRPAGELEVFSAETAMVANELLVQCNPG